jgi:hypothetical protein
MLTYVSSETLDADKTGFVSIEKINEALQAFGQVLVPI